MCTRTFIDVYRYYLSVYYTFRANRLQYICTRTYYTQYYTAVIDLSVISVIKNDEIFRFAEGGRRKKKSKTETCENRTSHGKHE